MNLTLKPVCRKDYKFLYNLLEDRCPMESISHKYMPTLKEHIAFNESKPYKYDFIIIENDKEIGRIYVSKCNEVGIHTVKDELIDYSQLVKLLVEKTGLRRLFFNIAPGNFNLYCFLELGGKARLIQYTYEYISNVI